MSQMGAIQSIDVQNPDIPMMRFAQTFDAQLTGLELMPSGKGFAMTDTHCQIILWASPSKIQFTEYTQPTEFADTPAPTKHLEWSHDVPLNLIGMPYYREALLSGWPNSLVHEVGAQLPRIDTATMTGMRKFEHGFVGPNLQKTRRHELEDTRNLHAGYKIRSRRFPVHGVRTERSRLTSESRLSTKFQTSARYCCRKHVVP